MPIEAADAIFKFLIADHRFDVVRKVPTTNFKSGTDFYSEVFDEFAKLEELDGNLELLIGKVQIMHSYIDE